MYTYSTNRRQISVKTLTEVSCIHIQGSLFMEEVLHTIRLWYYYYNTYLLLNSEENIYICYSSQVLIWLGKMYKCLKRAIPSRKCYIIYCSSLTKRSAIKEEINDLGPKFIFQRIFFYLLQYMESYDNVQPEMIALLILVM